MWFRPTSSSMLVVAYFDVDWAGCKDSCRSTIGYAIFLSPNMITWHSKKHSKLSKSSAKGEYRAIGYTVAETIRVCKIVYDLGMTLYTPVRLYCDNLSALHVCQ